jgi:hypothetical protein
MRSFTDYKHAFTNLPEDYDPRLNLGHAVEDDKEHKVNANTLEIQLTKLVK